MQYVGAKPIRFSDKGEKRTVKPGEYVSRRQYENLRFATFGWKNKSEYERVANNPGTLPRFPHEAKAFDMWARIYSEEMGGSKADARKPGSEYSQLFAAAYHDQFRDLSPDGPFAKLLVGIGLRSEKDHWNIGDTP